MNNQDQKLFYSLGYRDAIAMVLAEHKGKVKLPYLATLYEAKFNEQHFSHEWHIS